MKETTEQVRVEKSVLATYRWLSELTGIALAQLVSDTLRNAAKIYLVGANAALDGLAREEKKP